MAWNDMTPEQMEAHLIRQAQVIGIFRAALEEVDRIAFGHRKGGMRLAQVAVRQALKASERIGQVQL